MKVSQFKEKDRREIYTDICQKKKRLERVKPSGYYLNITVLIHTQKSLNLLFNFHKWTVQHSLRTALHEVKTKSFIKIAENHITRCCNSPVMDLYYILEMCVVLYERIKQMGRADFHTPQHLFLFFFLSPTNSLTLV